MKVERLNKKELYAYCENLGIETKKKKKQELVQAVYEYERAIIDEAIASGTCLELLKTSSQLS